MEDLSQINKVVVIGNSSGGKTVLSRQLGKIHNLLVIHIDSIQFIEGLKLRPYKETQAILDEQLKNDAWLVDGFGPLDFIENRLAMADRIVFVDLPLWHHFYWFGKRQLKNIFQQRPELPKNCNEATLNHTKKVIKTMWGIHFKMRPELLRILDRDHLKNKVIHIQNLKQWKEVYKNGLR